MGIPWMPLYAGDFLADTGHLNAAETGAYLCLIMHYWVKGGLPKDEAQLRRIARMTPRQWAESRDALAAFFDPEWRHERIQRELFEAATRSTQARAKALKSHKARRAVAKPQPCSSQPQPHKEERERDKLSLLESDWPDDWQSHVWAAYGKRTNRKKAEERLAQLRKGGKLPWDCLVAGLKRATAAVDHPHFLPELDRWIREERWNDEVLPRPSGNGGSLITDDMIDRVFGTHGGH